ncbi:hypothetical protein KIPB_007972, partial [Kipferlia bialata]|eukprot:g7972.t1
MTDNAFVMQDDHIGVFKMDRDNVRQRNNVALEAGMARPDKVVLQNKDRTVFYTGKQAEEGIVQFDMIQ